MTSNGNLKRTPVETTLPFLNTALQSLTPERLAGMRRGIEKESLRATLDGKLVHTPHPAALGSALTNPAITTDFSESQPRSRTSPRHVTPSAPASSTWWA